MTPKDFLYTELEKISLKFPTVNFKYGYDSSIETHIIIISPEEDFVNNNALDSVWVPLYFSFKEKYESEEIAFVPPSSPTSEIVVEFELNEIINTEVECIFQKLFSTSLNYSFPISVISKSTIYSSNQFINFPELTETEDIEGAYQLAA